MGNIQPFLQRRGGRYFFRIQVPFALRPIVGASEFTKTLKTGDRSAAVPLALALGATAKRLFYELRNPFMTREETLKLLNAARDKLQIDMAKEELDEEFDQAHRDRVAQTRLALSVQAGAFQQALATVLNSRSSAPHTSTHLLTECPSLAVSSGADSLPAYPAPLPPPAAASAVVCEPLRRLIDAFLDGYAKDKYPEMFKKLQAALSLLNGLYGAKAINQLKRVDVLDYFNVVEGLPPRWAQKCKKRGITPRVIAAEDHVATISSKTFADNYEVPVRMFFKWARLNWADQGFPLSVSTEGIEFSGEDNEGMNAQRAMKVAELEKLFHQVLTPFRGDKDQKHKWWLPVLAFYTGARINEMCQLNPQTDIDVSEDGINYVRITEATEGDKRVRKSVKTGEERYVPLHPELIKGGFLEYVAKVRDANNKLLFPAWNPTNSRASTQAERWFRDLLRASGLRDETPYARLVGFHSFRSTLLTLAADSDPGVDAGPITGHSDLAKGESQRKYEGPRSLPKKLKLLEAIQFGFSPFKPA